MKWEHSNSKKYLQAISLAIILILLITGHIFSEFKSNKNYLITRTTELGSMSFVKTSHKTELDVKMVDPAISRMWGIQSMKAQAAWKRLNAVGSRDIKVAIIDTGIDTHHPDLQRNLWVNEGETGLDKKGQDKRTNGKDDDRNGCIDDVHGCNLITMTGNVTDKHGHGTHIAGIIGATRGNGIGVSGVAPNVSMMILKYYDPKASGLNNLNNTVKAIHYAIEKGAHIINYSGGGVDPSPLEKAAIKAARKKGILFVAAAGNEKSNLDSKSKSYYPANYSFNNIISVTAFNKTKSVLPTSNYGASTVDIAAPGNQILSTLPAGQYGHMTGTSQATAFVTGVAALIMSKYRDFDAQKVIKHLTLTGDLDANLAGKTIYRKRLNTYRALAMLDQGVSATGTIATNTLSVGTFAIDKKPQETRHRSHTHSHISGIASFGKTLQNMVSQKSRPPAMAPSPSATKKRN